MTKRPDAAQTAFGPMVIAAVEQSYPEAQRIVRDDLAVRFLPPGMRFGVRLCKWSFMRDWGIRAAEKKTPGIWGSILCRKRYADDKVAEAIAAGIDQVVILGAGLDTRAYRLAVPAGVAAFEVDLPVNIAYKRERLRDIFGAEPERVALVPVDFQTDDLAAALETSGVRFERPIMVVWEGVTQYLTEDGFRSTLRVLSRAATGSQLIFTYVRADFLTGANFYGAEALYQDMRLKYEVWRFGIAPENAGGLLGEYGWTEREQVGRREYMTRFIEPSGRDLSVSDLERFVHAEKR
ncbi:class I SAM-dependent methyltransferase [Nannocystis punicea]|uniref:S-adenosyl-L-methionine-dependent methyltransferase n=1 Tax=Nannocystis punicea TaxID=2995304 RepID=A0ABY7GY57_9BACT|nr:class I SAM-dependent methyltransferase [Nannocystis poenicansa]WAS91902.1 class I SAM-dependent methyltransferase [Nannocystis poenicansa]